MAHLSINSGELPSAEGLEGSALVRVIGRWQAIANGRFPEDCKALLQMIDETDRLRLWEKSVGGIRYDTRDEFLRKHVLINFDLTERQLTDIVTRLKRGEKFGLGQALAADNEVKAAAPTRTAGPGRGHKTVDNVHGLSSLNSNSAERIVRRLKRDAPEIAKALARGEYKSARAAGIVAGFIKPPSKLELLRKAWRAASNDDRTTFLAEIAS